MARILIGGLFHETHTFLDGFTGLESFHCLRGEEMLACEGDSSPLGGVLELAREYGWEIIPTVDYRAQPSATVADEVVEQFWRELEERARPALADGIDAIYLILHGAMVSQTLLDVEGTILERLRALPGAAALPIFGVYDLHAHFTEKMATYANCLVAYRENPHTDAREAGCTAARLLQRCLTSCVKPITKRRHSGLMWPPTGTGTANDPMLTLENTARQLEAEYPQLWSVNVVAGFSFADTPATGVCFEVAYTPGAEETADQALEILASKAMQLHSKGLVTDPPADEVLAGLNPLPPGLTVLVEPADNIGGGAPGDCTGLLRALIRHGIKNAAVAIADPISVKQARVGETMELEIGGRGSRLDEGPVKLEVKVLTQQAGRFELEDKNSHLASMSGDFFDMGECALVEHAGIKILLTSVKTPPFDLGQWRSQGVEPTELSVICVKAAVAHRRAYDPIATRMLWVDTPGPCSSDLTHFEYRHAKAKRTALL